LQCVLASWDGLPGGEVACGEGVCPHAVAALCRFLRAWYRAMALLHSVQVGWLRFWWWRYPAIVPQAGSVLTMSPLCLRISRRSRSLVPPQMPYFWAVVTA